MLTNVNRNPVDIDIKELSKDLSQAVQQVREIQVLVNSFINEILVRKNDEVDKETGAIKAAISQIRVIRVELEKLGTKYSKVRLNNIHPVPLGNTGYVSLDSTEEQSGFYKELLDCYTWLKNVDEDATRALELLESKQKISTNNVTSKTSGQSLLELVGELKSKFPGVMFNEDLLASEGVLIFQVGKVFAADLFFSGLMVSHVIVKSMVEKFTLKHWETSNHAVFQTLSEIFTCMVLKLKHNNPKDLLEEMLDYMFSYKGIFQNKCTVCNKHLSTDSGSTTLLPPLLKELKGELFYHLSCK